MATFSPVTARTLALALSIWVFASSFLLPRPDRSFTIAWLAGLLSAALAVGALARERLRWGGAAVALWLAASPLLVPAERRTVRLHDAVVGLALLGLALLPGRAPRRVRNTGRAPPLPGPSPARA